MYRTAALVLVASVLTGCALIQPESDETAVPNADRAEVDSIEEQQLPPDISGGDSATQISTATDVSPAAAHLPATTEPPTADTTPVPMMSVSELCDELGGLLSSVSVEECRAAGLNLSGAYSHHGRPLVFAEFAAHQQAAPRILVVGGIHGDEYASVSMVFRWLERLRHEHSGELAWRLAPSTNPDGLLAPSPATRTNAAGVDLNRNFATTNWVQNAHQYWQEKTHSDPRRMPGNSPASEPETRWLQSMILDWQPDVIISLHAPHDLLDFDNTTSVRVTPPPRLGFLELAPLGTYPGSLGRWGSEETEVPVLTLELPWAGIMPSQPQQEALWEDLMIWVSGEFRTAQSGAAPVSQSQSTGR